jgi:hypothetical protein
MQSESASSMATLPGVDNPPMHAGVPDLDEATIRRVLLIEEAGRPGTVANAEFFGSVGDVVCSCGFWQPSTQNICRRGQVQRTLIDANRTPLVGINGRSEIVANQPEGVLRQRVFDVVERLQVRWNCERPRRSIADEFRVGFAVVPLVGRTTTKPKAPAPRKAKPKATPRGAQTKVFPAPEVPRAKGVEPALAEPKEDEGAEPALEEPKEDGSVEPAPAVPKVKGVRVKTEQPVPELMPARTRAGTKLALASPTGPAVAT